jgi:hypothetical protein
MKQRLEKYSERFDNDKSAIGNPETWGKRMVEEPKQETLEEAAFRIFGADEDGEYIAKRYFIRGAKWQQERSYSEEDMIKFMQFIVSEEELENTSGVSIDTAKYFLNKFKNK